MEARAPKALSRLFDRFYQCRADARRAREPASAWLSCEFDQATGGRVTARKSSSVWRSISTCPAQTFRDLAGRSEMTRTRSIQPPNGPMVLIVEDDAETRGVLSRELASRGYQVEVAQDGATAIHRWEGRRPDLILLDLGLPDIDGLHVIGRVRRDATTPIVILSGRYEEREKVEALERGADDYVTKPFGVDELNARLRVALRHSAGPAAAADGRVHAGLLVLDAGRHEVRVGRTPIDLTPIEFEILRVLLSHSGRLVTKGRLLRAVWGEAYQDADSYVYVHVSQLRRKLAAADPDGTLRDLIVTGGVGYRIRERLGPAGHRI
jgi:two-component system KDP operon response regulator KdpE